MAVTQKQIADALGLSRSVVGEALSGHPRIAEQTRARVLEKARELGYDPGANSEARSLIAKRYGQRVKTNTLGLVMEYADTTKGDVGILAFQGVHRAVRRHDFDVLVMKRDVRIGKTGLNLVQDTRIDGVIFVNGFTLRETLDHFVAAGVPIVTCMSNDNPPGVPSIMVDNHRAMRLAVDHLVSLGHRKLVHLKGAHDHCDAQERRAGFELAMQAHGLELEPDSVVNAGWTPGGCNEGAMAALKTDATGFVCSNDHQALELKNMALEMGLRVPEDISIVGMDNFGLSAEHDITTVTNPLVEMGQLAVEAWMALSNGAPAEELSKIVPVELVIRQSTGQAAI